MVKQQYRILKYIYKNPRITKSSLLKKFYDFEKYKASISEYVHEENENKDIESKIRDSLIADTNGKGMSMSEIENYVKNNMPEDIQNIIDNSLIFFSTNLKFQEYFEKKRHDTLLFWLPYTITTIIAIASLIARFYGK